MKGQGTKGRCAGCETTGLLKAVTTHVVTCQAWAALYRENPARALSPEAEYARWEAEDRKSERTAAVEARIQETDDRRAAMASRFAYRDVLED